MSSENCGSVSLRCDGGEDPDRYDSGRYQVDILDGWPLVLYQDAREAWGHEPQITLAQEELAELNVELARHFRGRNDSEDVIDEIADVLIAVNQLALIFGLGETEGRVEYKLKRLRKRVDEYQDGDSDE